MNTQRALPVNHTLRYSGSHTRHNYGVLDRKHHEIACQGLENSENLTNILDPR